MLSRDECLRYAVECEIMSRIARENEDRERLTEIAGHWRELADSAAPAERATERR